MFSTQYYKPTHTQRNAPILIFAEVATILPRQAMAKTVRDLLLKQDLAIKAAAQRALW